jgi:hypothetical protein
MLSVSLQLFFLRALSIQHFDFPRWQSALALCLLGLLVSLDPDLRAAPPGTSPPPWTVVVLATLLALWAAFLLLLAVLRWWMRRSGRWDGRGDLFNLLAASWLLADALVLGLTILSVPTPFVLPIGLYGIWVGANAVHGAIPKAGLGYLLGFCFAGFLFSLVPGLVATLMAFTYDDLLIAGLGLLSAGR